MIEVTQEFINQFITDYNNKYDTNLNNQLALLPRPMSANAFVTRVSEFMDMYVKRHCPNYIESFATQDQQKAVYNAKLEQAFYILWNEDLTLVNGIDFAKGTAISQEVLEKAKVSKMAEMYLENNGLMYRGINGTGGVWYGSDYWRAMHNESL